MIYLICINFSLLKRSWKIADGYIDLFKDVLTSKVKLNGSWIHRQSRGRLSDKRKDRLTDSKQSSEVTPTESHISAIMSCWELDPSVLCDLTTLANDHNRAIDLEQIRLLK